MWFEVPTVAGVLFFISFLLCSSFMSWMGPRLGYNNTSVYFWSNEPILYPENMVVVAMTIVSAFVGCVLLSPAVVFQEQTKLKIQTTWAQRQTRTLTKQCLDELKAIVQLCREDINVCIQPQEPFSW